MKQTLSFENPSGIQVFENEQFGSLRAMLNENGEALFMGTDVARRLGYKNPHKALRDHVDEEDKLTERIVLSGQRRELIFINESGLYSLILSSKLPSAKAFKRWVTAEVLPQIRQTGGYIPIRNARTGEALTAEEIVSRAMGIMQKTISRENLPADGCVSTTQIAELYGMDVKDLYSFLRDEGIVKRVSGHYHLTPRYADKGYDKERIHHSFSLDGREKVKPYMVWTPAGVEFIERLMKN